MFTVSFVFLYKLNSYMKAAWAITGAHTKLHAIVAVLSTKLDQLQPAAICTHHARLLLAEQQLKLKATSTPLGASKQIIIRTNQNYSFLSIFPTPVLTGLCYKKSMEKKSNPIPVEASDAMMAVEAGHGSLRTSMTQFLTLMKHFMENLSCTISYMRRFM